MQNFPKRYTWAALLLVVPSGCVQANTIISAQFQGTNGSPLNFQGVEADAAAADPVFANSNQWNHFRYSAQPFSNLITSTGTNSGAVLSVALTAGYNDFSSNLPDTYFFRTATDAPFSISSLAPNRSFTLFLYALNSARSANDRGEIFTVGASTFVTATGHASSLDSAHAVDGVITGVTSSTGTISGTWGFDPTNRTGEIDWSGFQLDVSSAPAATPEPGTIVLLVGGVGLIIGGRKFLCLNS